VKQLVVVALVVVALLGALNLTASSQTADGLDAVVTPFGVAITIDEETVNFGVLPLSPADDDRSTADSTVISVFNDGSAPADLMIQGSNAVPGTLGEADWVLDCFDANGLVGANQFALLFALDSNPIDWAQDGDSLCPGGTKTLQQAVAGGNAADFVLQMNMPTATNGFSARTSTVTVTATQAGP